MTKDPMKEILEKLSTPLDCGCSEFGLPAHPDTCDKCKDRYDLLNYLLILFREQKEKNERTKRSG